MIVKKLVLILFIGVIPTSSFALSKLQTMALVGVGYIACLGAVGGYLYYSDKQKEKAEREFWNGKSDKEMAQLVNSFVQEVESYLAIQLTNFRKSRKIVEKPHVKGDLQCFNYIRKTIPECSVWLKRLQNRTINQLVEKVQILQSDLIELIAILKIYVNKSFIEKFENLENRPVPTIFLNFHQ